MSARETEGVVEENELGIQVFLGGSKDLFKSLRYHFQIYKIIFFLLISSKLYN
jgi:hypothetical protein